MIFGKIILLSFMFSMAQSEVTEPVAADDVAISVRTSDFDFNRYRHSRCENFIKSTGELGTWGRELIDSIDRVGSDCFYNSDVFVPLCPNYRSLSLESKRQFIAYLWAFISDNESIHHRNPEEDTQRCSLTGITSSPAGGDFVGLMRLERNRSMRRLAGRSRQFCDQGDVMSVSFQMQCSLSLFSDLHCRNSTRNIPLSRTYWVSLRRATDTDRSRIAEFPGCRTP